MSQVIKIEPLSAEAFAPFGDVMDTSGASDKLINQGNCKRHHDRAKLDFTDGAAGISLFDAKPRHLPLTLDMVERHPAGSQAFVPMSLEPFLVIVAADADGVPVEPRAFVTKPGQAINFHRGTWHGVLTPLFDPNRTASGLFAVIDRIGGAANNLEEHWFETPYSVEA